MEYYLDKSHVSPGERAAFQAFLDAGFVDVVRPHTPDRASTPTGTTQRLAFQKRRGMRIDFILGSPAVRRPGRGRRDRPRGAQGQGRLRPRARRRRAPRLTPFAPLG